MDNDRSLVDPSPPAVSSSGPSSAPKRPRGRPARKRRAAGGAPPIPIEIAFERDLCTCTYDEIQKRWPTARRDEIARVKGKPWDELVTRDHQFVYYLAEKVWFDNTRYRPDDDHAPGAAICNPKCKHRYLYADLHRDRYLRPITSYVIDPTIDEECDGVLALGPRDSYKSTLAAALLMAHILRCKHVDGFDARDVIAHHKFTMASRSLRRIAARFRFHPYMRRFWNEYCPPEDCKQFGTQDEFTLPNAGFTGEQGEATCRAVGATASDTGSHVDLRVNDDLVTEDHINSKAIRDESKIKYEAAQFTRDTVGGKEVNFGTPYHVNDLWASMIRSNVEGESRYKVIIVPAIGTRVKLPDGREVTQSICRRCGHGIDDHPPTEGVPIELAPCVAEGCSCREAAIYAHPYRLTKAFLDKKMQAELSRTGRIVLWYLQYQCEGKSSYQTAASLDWIVWATQADIPEGATPIIFIDPAWKGTENQGEGDSASIQVHFLERRGGLIFRWVADGVHSNELTQAEGIREALRLSEQYNVSDFAPEEHGGYGFRTSLMAAGNEKGIGVNIIELKMKQSGKDQRIVSWLRELEERRVIFCKDMNPELLEALKDQVKDYPQLDHDDAVDCAAYSCDPNVADHWVPKFRRRALRRAARSLPTEAPMTRHCGV